MAPGNVGIIATLVACKTIRRLLRLRRSSPEFASCDAWRPNVSSGTANYPDFDKVACLEGLPNHATVMASHHVITRTGLSSRRTGRISQATGILILDPMNPMSKDVGDLSNALDTNTSLCMICLMRRAFTPRATLI